MSDNRNDKGNQGSDEIEAAFLESLARLDKLTGRTDNDPVDAHEYVDPEKDQPEVYDKMVSEIERKRSERSKSIWSDEPVIPVEKSVWLDNDEPAPRRERQRESKRLAPEGSSNRSTIELKLSDSMRRKMADSRPSEPERPVRRAPEEEYSERPRRRRPRPEEGEQPRRRQRPAEEQVSSRRQRPAEEQVSSRRQRPAEEQVSSRRQRPAEEQVSSRRQRPAEEQVSSRRQRPAEEQVSSRRQRPAEEQVSSRRQRPAEEQTSSRTRERAPQEQAPARPRRNNGKSKYGYRKYEAEFSFINAALCVLMVFGVGIALVVMKRASGKIESENRMMAEFPEVSISNYLDGTLTDGIVKYYTDTIPDRESLKGFSSSFSKLFGINMDNYSTKGDIHQGKEEKIDSEMEATATKATVYTGSRATTSASTGGKTLDDSDTESQPGNETETETSPIATVTKDVVPDEGEWAGNVVLADSGTPNVRAMPVFYGLFENGDKYASILNSYKEMLGETVNVYNMQIPLASAYYMPKNLEGTGSDQHEYLRYVNLSLKGVIGVDIFDALKAHTDEYIYSRTDHHWQPLGAYYAAQEFAKEAGVPFADLSTYEKCKIEGFCGTMYAYSEYNPDLKKWPDTFWYYKPQNNYTIDYYNDTFSAIDENKGHSLFFDWVSGANCYSAILGGDLDIPEIKTDVHNGRTLVVIKDSYGNAMIPFLTQSFEKIYVVDFRYVNISMRDFLNRIGATDVLFGLSISGSYTYSHINTIGQIKG